MAFILLMHQKIRALLQAFCKGQADRQNNRIIFMGSRNNGVCQFLRIFRLVLTSPSINNNRFGTLCLDGGNVLLQKLLECRNALFCNRFRRHTLQNDNIKHRIDQIALLIFLGIRIHFMRTHVLFDIMIGETAGADRNDAGFPILFVFSCQASQIAVNTAVIEAVRVADDQAGFR